MPLHAPVKGGDFTPAPAGVQPAICCDVVDLGLVETSWGTKHKIWISWLLGQLDPESGKPYLVTKRYTFSMHEKSNLYADLCSWLSIMMSPEQAEKCDIEKMIGRPCLLNIVHNTRDGSTYANVNTVMPLPNGYPVPQMGDYKRHVHRDANENPKDARNPHSPNYQPQTSVSDTQPQPPPQALPQQPVYQQPASPIQQPPAPPQQPVGGDGSHVQQAPGEQMYQTQQPVQPQVQPASTFQPNPAFQDPDGLPF